MLGALGALTLRAGRFLVPGALSLALLAPAAGARELPPTFADMVEGLLPAVVNISTTQTVEESQQMMPPVPEGSPMHEFFRDFLERGPQPTPREVSALGSGFIIDQEGHVVTNSHVVAMADEIRVILSDERTLEATVIGSDPATDLALLKIETDGPLPYVKWGKSEETRVGDWVVAIGNPFGLGGSVTVGVLSARARDIQAGPYDDFLQTDAAINRGNSGGPLFGANGEVIGVTTVILSPSGGNIGIGFAIPSSTAQTVIQQLKEHGEVRRGWLGVQIQPVTEPIAEAIGLEAPRGALVAEVIEGGPAEQAGLKTGDVVVKYAGTEIDEMRELPRLVADTPIGETVEIEVWRDGARETVSAKIAKQEPGAMQLGGLQPEPSPPSNGVLGMMLAPLTPDAKESLGLQSEEDGVLVAEVSPQSVAAEQGIQPGDVIVEVAREPVATPEEAAQRIADASKQHRPVLLLMNRGGNRIFVALPVA